jgi:hypothetical protein
MRRLLGAGLISTALQFAVPWQASAQSVSIQWSGNGHLYQVVFVSSGLNWVQAFMRTRERGCGWYLATITSAAEDAFVFGLIRSRPEFFADGLYGPWLGAFQKSSKFEPASDWRWVTEESFSYTHWSSGKPDNNSLGLASIESGITEGQHEDFLHYFSDGAWNDLNVEAQPRGYIAEFDTTHQRLCTP